MGDRAGSVEEQVRQLYGDAEARTAQAWEDVVRRESFGELLAHVTENVMGVTRIGIDVFDLVVRNLRLAGRRDITKLGTQLARTEDKLEMVLQEVERLRDELAEAREERAPARKPRDGAAQSGSRAHNRS